MLILAKIAYRYRVAREIARGHRSRLDVVVAALYRLARLAERWGPRRARGCRRIVHVSPSYFAEESVLGGGERYAVELAAAMAPHADVTLVAFGPRRRSFRHKERLRVEVYPVRRYLGGHPINPVSFRFLTALWRAEVIHCHQHEILLTNLCTLAGALLRCRVYVTDLGATAEHYGDRYPLDDLVDGFVAISEFAGRRHVARLAGTEALGVRRWALGVGADEGRTTNDQRDRLPAQDPTPNAQRPTPNAPPPAGRVRVVVGGVDVEALRPEEGVEKTHALYVGRLLPHKGINDLIAGMPADVPLRVVGRPYHEEYFELLRRLARDKRVEFVTDAGDAELRQQYQTAFVTVLPSVYRDVYGTRYDRPELLGLVLLESMACGTPVICTRVGAMPEIVEDGVTGFIVPPNDPAALGDCIRRLAADPELVRRMGAAGCQRVVEQWSWDRVAERCLEAYRGA
jgi:glycosyltransferase involved in cell wall biosynthesis